jgi:chromatin assembly factor 1 subunit B
MHVYSIAESQGRLQVHAVGKNSRMEVQHPPGGSWRPPTPAITPSASEDKEKTLSTTTSGKGKDVEPRPSPHHRPISRTNSDRSESSSTTFSLSRPSLDASTSMPAMAMDDSESTNSMDPPLAHHHRPSSRRSSTSGSHPPHSPALLPQQPPFRSPSPAPLPAIKVPLSPTMGAHNGGSKIETLKLYTDANSTPFFRRLSWSTDGSLLLTPAGLFEDPYAGIGKTATNEGAGAGPGARKKVGEKQQRKNPNPVATSSAPTTSGKDATAAKPTVYIYSRSNVARPPIAHLPGHKTTSIAIRFRLVGLEEAQAFDDGGGRGRRRGRRVRERAVGEGDGRGQVVWWRRGRGGGGEAEESFRLAISYGLRCRDSRRRLPLRHATGGTDLHVWEPSLRALHRFDLVRSSSSPSRLRRQ